MGSASGAAEATTASTGPGCDAIMRPFATDAVDEPSPAQTIFEISHARQRVVKTHKHDLPGFHSYIESVSIESVSIESVSIESVSIESVSIESVYIECIECAYVNARYAGRSVASRGRRASRWSRPSRPSRPSGRRASKETHAGGHFMALARDFCDRILEVEF